MSRGLLKNGLIRLVRMVPWLTQQQIDDENKNFEGCIVRLTGGYGIKVEQIMPGQYRISLDEDADNSSSQAGG